MQFMKPQNGNSGWNLQNVIRKNLQKAEQKENALRKENRLLLCQRALQNISRIDCCNFLQIISNRIMERSVLLLCTTIKERPIITFI